MGALTRAYVVEVDLCPPIRVKSPRITCVLSRDLHTHLEWNSEVRRNYGKIFYFCKRLGCNFEEPKGSNQRNGRNTEKISLRKLFLNLTVSSSSFFLFSPFFFSWFQERNRYRRDPISASTVIGRGSGINRLIVIASTISGDIDASSFSFPPFCQPVSENRRHGN